MSKWKGWDIDMVGKIRPVESGYGIYGVSFPWSSSGRTGAVSDPDNPKETALSDGSLSSSKAVKKTECQTCKNRKYVDGSDEMVSFKAPAKMSPGRAASGVRAHEQEHVSNAFEKAAKGDGKVLQASVALKTAICPECGRAYIAGGTTTTKIAYKKDDPYSENQKSMQQEAATGNNVDIAV